MRNGIEKPTSVVESLTWDASNLGTADGSAVELLLTFTNGGGGPNERNIEVGAVEWNVDYEAAAAPSGTLSGEIQALSMTAAGEQQFLATGDFQGQPAELDADGSIVEVVGTATFERLTNP